MVSSKNNWKNIEDKKNFINQVRIGEYSTRKW